MNPLTQENVATRKDDRWGTPPALVELLAAECCKYIEFIPGEDDYSQYTPGYKAQLFCKKKHWKVNTCGGETTSEVRAKFETAKTCKDFTIYREHP